MQFARDSVLVLLPFLIAGLIGGLLFSHLAVALLIAVAAFIFVQLLYLYRFRKWAERRTEDLPLGLNPLWKPLYLLLRDVRQDSQKDSVTFSPLSSISADGDYGFVIVHGSTIEWMNNKAAQLLKFDMERDIGSDMTYLLRDPQFLQSFDEKQFNCEIELETWQPPLAICLIPYGEQYILLIIRNLSELVRARNSSQELISNVSHELRSPLTVIQGYFEVLAEEIEDPKLALPLESMRQHILRMNHLVDDTLSIGWLEHTDLREKDQQNVDVPVLLHNLLKELEDNEQEEDYHFETKIEDFGLYGSPSELQSVFINLLDNAKQHSQPQDAITVKWLRTENEACFEVSDQGDGIEAHHLPYLTNRFYRIDKARSRAVGGTGLGLAIVKKILARHQGRLTISSKLGQGSCFRCHFPASRIVPAEQLTETTSDVLLS